MHFLIKPLQLSWFLEPGGAQFKNKSQFYWLLTVATLATADCPTPLRLAHHFFQSCHGKGPSYPPLPSLPYVVVASSSKRTGPYDSEGATIKCALRLRETQGHYMADSKAVFDWLDGGHLSKSTKDYGNLDGKMRHTIVSRVFVFIPDDAVDHLALPAVADIEVRTMAVRVPL